ncbi:hypothetical protein M569_00112 [Genlisea aurea]|uniref:Uncharacterized protein n=1 Tax=Genlisea aurea TaxID=192259 RepID=S8EF44_9LAMI|nr:hypothetical protein M569_00112 [Genlisea aurea]
MPCPCNQQLHHPNTRERNRKRPGGAILDRNTRRFPQSRSNNNDRKRERRLRGELCCGRGQRRRESISEVLRIYELISGQQVNLEKSSVVLVLLKKPSLLLYGIVFKWDTKLLSPAGKLVLAVLQAISEYAMSVFLLPKSLMAEIQSLFANFWWNNRALICKQSWRILIPHLVGQVWRTHLLFGQLQLGRDLQPFSGACGIIARYWVKGFGGVLVLGLAGCVWRDPWLPRHPSFRPLWRNPTLPDNLTVDSLIDGFLCCWKVEYLRDHFQAEDVAAILSIPLGAPSLCLSSAPLHDKLGIILLAMVYHF